MNKLQENILSATLIVPELYRHAPPFCKFVLGVFYWIYALSVIQFQNLFWPDFAARSGTFFGLLSMILKMAIPSSLKLLHVLYMVWMWPWAECSFSQKQLLAGNIVCFSLSWRGWVGEWCRRRGAIAIWPPPQWPYVYSSTEAKVFLWWIWGEGGLLWLHGGASGVPLLASERGFHPISLADAVLKNHLLGN